MHYMTFSFAIAFLILFGDLARAQSGTEGPPEPSIQVGDVAPDFTLKDQDMRDVTLSEFRGKKNVILAFYVFAFTDG